MLWPGADACCSVRTAFCIQKILLFLVQTVRIEHWQVRPHHISTHGRDHDSDDDEEDSEADQRPRSAPLLGPAAVTLEIISSHSVIVELAYRPLCCPGVDISDPDPDPDIDPDFDQPKS